MLQKVQQHGYGGIGLEFMLDLVRALFLGFSYLYYHTFFHMLAAASEVDGCPNQPSQSKDLLSSFFPFPLFFFCIPAGKAQATALVVIRDLLHIQGNPRVQIGA